MRMIGSMVGLTTACPRGNLTINIRFLSPGALALLQFKTLLVVVLILISQYVARALFVAYNTVELLACNHFLNKSYSQHKPPPTPAAHRNQARRASKPRFSWLSLGLFRIQTNTNIDIHRAKRSIGSTSLLGDRLVVTMA